MAARSSRIDLVIPPEIAEFLDAGPIMHLATRNADLVPDEMFVAGARVDAELNLLDIYVAEALAGSTLANLRDNGEVALTATRVTDNRSVQLKGALVSDRPGEDHDRAVLSAMQERGRLELAMIGMPRSITARIVDWPCIVLSVRVREIYEQTPGPRAGQPLEGGAGPL